MKKLDWIDLITSIMLIIYGYASPLQHFTRDISILINNASSVNYSLFAIFIEMLLSAMIFTIGCIPAFRLLKNANKNLKPTKG